MTKYYTIYKRVVCGITGKRCEYYFEDVPLNCPTKPDCKNCSTLKEKEVTL